MEGRADELRDAAEVARFDHLFREHAAPVLRFFIRQTGDRAVAEDLRSAVFYEAWRRRRDVDLTTRDPLPWLFGVAANVMRNHRRSLRRHAAAMRRLGAPMVQPDTADEVTDRLDALQRARALLALVQGLPQGEREVVVLCLAQSLSYRSAAAELNVPVGTVRSRLSRARARLELLSRNGRSEPFGPRGQ